MTTLPAVLEEYLAAIRALDADRWVATFAADAVCEDPLGSPPRKGREAHKAFFLGLAQGFREVALTPEHVFAAGGAVAVKWTGLGLGRNGRVITFEGIDVFHLNAQGKIRRVEGFWDPSVMMGQLSAAPVAPAKHP